jgi:hypothetical protein
MARINDFKAKMINGGARSNQFRVRVDAPVGISPFGETLSILCSAAALPAVTVENIPVQFRGMPVNFAGERTYAPWTITVINEMGTGDDIRDKFEAWSRIMKEFEASNGAVSPLDYNGTLHVDQLDRNGLVLKTYDFYNAFPTEIGTIALSYENPAIETFDVSFIYDYYTPSNV